ncbi:carboxypeptidase regulatory-like domain-containing protein [Ramlibacter sp. 2FC]|uniref:carboxypeptidase regulatory-like domain-containing protein n=1 Tax=Ramlibacter sp. 2FC TaxID=2502188 RepID=UPI0010FA2A8B|nr:carboxypeptidase regulatory-like domain-containing protein [Ramlibacter sp. 2FC]
MKMTTAKLALAMAGAATLTLSGCGGDSSTASGVTIAGTVSAPGGQVAFNQPTDLLSRLARLFISSAFAQTSGMFSGVGAGVAVNLIETDAAGNQVGSPLASATTDATGAYSLTAPEGFTPSSKYVVRATASGGQLDAIVTGTTVNVDPVTNATTTLVLASASASGLASVTTAEVTAVEDTIQALANDGTSYASATEATTQLRAKAQADEETSNIVSSVVSSGVISGSVKDANGQALAGIKIVARDFGNWVTRAIAYTDTTGQYTLNVPAGDYILGAFNHTGTSTAASEWWTQDGGAANQFSAEKVAVAGSAVSTDFVLEPGVRISGKVTGAGSALGGIKVHTRDVTSDQPVTGTMTGPDGAFRLNVRPGTYTLAAVNTTQQPFATQYYVAGDTTAGTASEASPLTASLGTELTTNFALPAGYQISGKVSDPTTGNVTGISVRFYDGTVPDSTTGAFVNGLRTDLQGQYRLWLAPKANYIVRTRGQTQTADISSGIVVKDFSAAVGTVTAKLTGPGGLAVSQAKVAVYDGSAGYQGFEVSNADGSVTLYSTISPVRVEFKIDNGTAVGSSLYNGQTQFSLASDLSIVVGGTSTDLGTVALPVGGVLSGTVRVGGAPKGNYAVQLRSGGNAFPTNQFVATRTQSDGSYSISLPYGIYNIRACIPGNCSGAFSSVTINSSAHTKDFSL